MSIREETVTYKQIADNDLKDFGFCASPTSKRLLKKGHKDMSKRGGNDRPIECHFGYTWGHVTSVLWTVFGDHRGKKLLKAMERA